MVHGLQFGLLEKTLIKMEGFGTVSMVLLVGLLAVK
jgi:hypothetical protein